VKYPSNWRSVEQRGCKPDCHIPHIRLERREVEKGVLETRHAVPKRTLFYIADRRHFYIETGKVGSKWLAEGKKPSSKKLFYGSGTSERQAVQNLLFDMGVKAGTCE
jgi:hypothetical protein